MPDGFQFDVFLNHNAKDNAVARKLAERLKKEGVRVWLDKEQIKPDDSIPEKTEEWMENSHELVLWMSANAFGSDRAQLEAGTFGRRNCWEQQRAVGDPLNKEPSLVPMWLDDAPIKGSLAQFVCISERSAIS